MDPAGNQADRIRVVVQVELEIVTGEAVQKASASGVADHTQGSLGDSMKERERAQRQVSEKSAEARPQSEGKRPQSAYARIEQQKYDWLAAQAELRRQSIHPGG